MSGCYTDSYIVCVPKSELAKRLKFIACNQISYYDNFTKEGVEAYDTQFFGEYYGLKDVYDWGGSVLEVLKGTTRAKVFKNLEKSRDILEFGNYRKYSWGVVDCGQIGYEAWGYVYKSRVEKVPSGHIRYKYKTEKGHTSSYYRTLAEAKASLLSLNKTGTIYAELGVKDRGRKVVPMGSVVRNTRYYKTEPKVLPKKYVGCKPCHVFSCAVTYPN